MIGRIRGLIIEKQPPHLLLEVGGLAYEVSAPMTTFYHLPGLQQEVTLYTHLVIREDAHQLYGFYNERDRKLFRSLIKVNGVGPKLALTILSGIEPDYFVQCVLNSDASTLTGIPGIGKKTAERLIMETKDALADWDSAVSSEKIDGLTATPQASQNIQDAISALIALGYKPNEAKRSVMQIHHADYSSEDIIRLALKHMLTGDK